MSAGVAPELGLVVSFRHRIMRGGAESRATEPKGRPAALSGVRPPPAAAALSAGGPRSRPRRTPVPAARPAGRRRRRDRVSAKGRAAARARRECASRGAFGGGDQVLADPQCRVHGGDRRVALALRRRSVVRSVGPVGWGRTGWGRAMTDAADDALSSGSSAALLQEGHGHSPVAPEITYNATAH